VSPGLVGKGLAWTKFVCLRGGVRSGSEFVSNTLPYLFPLLCPLAPTQEVYYTEFLVQPLVASQVIFSLPFCLLHSELACPF